MEAEKVLIWESGRYHGKHRKKRENEHPPWKDQYSGEGDAVPAFGKNDKVALEAGNLAFIITREIIEFYICNLTVRGHFY